MNTPLTYKEQALFSLYIILLLPTNFVFGVGIVPTLAIFVGVFFAKREEDFGYLETSFKVVQYYIGIAAIGLGIALAISALSYSNLHFQDLDMFVIASIPLFYLYGFNYAVVAPLRKHHHWVVTQGIFLSKEKTAETRTTPLVSFKRSSNLSVADELLKWNKLKDGGLVTEEEFAKARKNLLG